MNLARGKDDEALTARIEAICAEFPLYGYRRVRGRPGGFPVLAGIVRTTAKLSSPSALRRAVPVKDHVLQISMVESLISSSPM